MTDMGIAIEPIGLLRRLGDEYHHVKQEHQRQPLRSATRRRLESRLRGIQDHSEHLLTEWATEPSLRERWREFLYGHASAPDEPHLPAPPLFKGRTDAGAVIELRPAATGYEILVDGWSIYNKRSYDAVKRITDPDNQFRDLYEKTCRAAMGHPA